MDALKTDPRNVVACVWAAWLVVWLLLARGAARSRESETGASRSVHIVMMVCAFALLTPYPRLGWLSARALPQGNSTLAAGYAILLAGFGFSVWARLLLGRNWSGRVTIKEGHELIQRGPYALVRHPIYTGIIAAMLGSAVAIGEVRSLAAAAIFAVAYMRKIPMEEAKLERHFGADYARYRGRTKAVIPFIL